MGCEHTSQFEKKTIINPQKKLRRGENKEGRKVKENTY
jgi:hypothetical protein